MRVAKATDIDIDMSLRLCNFIQQLDDGYLPACLYDENNENIVWYDHAEHSEQVINKIIEIFNEGSLFRVAFGMGVLIDPKNEVVNPLSDALEAHPKYEKLKENNERLIYKAKELIARWDSANWKDSKSTADYINALRNEIPKGEES